MENSITLENLLMKIGAVSGQTLSLIDASQLGNKEIFINEDFLSGIPGDMIKQVALMISPAQQRNLDKIGIGSGYNRTLSATVPEVDFVVRAWFSTFDSNGAGWCEAFNNFESLVLAGEHLRQRFPKEKKTWKFATKSKEDNTWETFEVRFEKPGFADLTLHRNDFEAPQKVHEKARLRLEEFLSDQAGKILGLIQSHIDHPSARNQISLAVIQGDQSDFYPLSPNAMERSIQLIPFIPVSIGGLHNVVPISKFSKDLRKIIHQGAWEANFFFYNKLSQMFENEVIRANVMKYLVGDTGNGVSWEIDGTGGFALGESYDGHWTFLEDIEADETEYREPYNYLTIEPVSHPYPLGQSMCGALAAMVVQTILYPDRNRKNHYLKGWNLSGRTRWTERAFNTRLIQVSNASEGLWSIGAPVRIFGELTCTNLDFIRAGSK